MEPSYLGGDMQVTTRPRGKDVENQSVQMNLQVLLAALTGQFLQSRHAPTYYWSLQACIESFLRPLLHTPVPQT
eukprot:727885-Amphidinium_carterae.1